jgi:shikimate kinase/3-dehydroquinate synthase
MITRILLTGMSGAGKSTVGSIVAPQLGWRFVDMDDAIEQREGRSIPDIFESDGESAFRAMEAELLASLLEQQDLVISSGGGAVCNDTAQAQVRESEGTLTVWLHAEAGTLWKRVNEHSDDSRTTARPMLDHGDPLERMRQLLDSRQEYYGAADITIPVGQRPAERTAADLEELVRLASGGTTEVDLDTGKVQSNIVIGNGVADSLSDVIATRWPEAQTVWIGADANVVKEHAEWIAGLHSGLPARVEIHEIASGEASKSLESYGKVMGWMLEHGVQRGDVAVALGGGVVGDLMGFAAATVLRGIGLVQVPTTLLAMVDSSVGGKTGINHPAGKNLIGAFYQPPVVLVDTMFLRSLPAREMRSGFAEVIKHGIIQASAPGGENGFLTEVLRLNSQRLLHLWEPLLSWVIRQNITLKTSVVAEDEREADLRQTLNFGHTIGHGIEAAGYRLLHGEAIGVGMIAATWIAVAQGSVARDVLDSLRSTIEAFGLPTSANVSIDEVLGHMQADKKKVAGKQNWVLPVTDGGVQVTSDVSSDLVESAIRTVLA